MARDLVLVTGATGLIGNAVAKRLVAKGATVRALVRDMERAKKLLPSEVELARGDITDRGSVDAAMQGVGRVFHTAGMPEQWQRDDGVFDRVNRGGTVNVLESALAAKVDRVAYTSTMDVFAAPPGGTLVETNLDPDPKPTPYERSKQAADREVESIRKKGLDVVHLNPAAVYGPSPVHVALNDYFLKLLNRKLPLLPPGGVSVAYVEPVAEAHVAAMERGVSGERYLLADEHLSMARLAEIILEQSGKDMRVPARGPLWLLRALAAASAPLARTFAFTPLVAPGQLSFLTWDAHVDATKAKRELGYTPKPVAEGVRSTIAFLRDEGLVPSA
ncbi:MAG: SDR family NAD(P)-dependent oxidoreductase [Deltaproteobacteria bacterium]|nr:SDR family NAD(P)-dependent oxidoreductase [Deltaproteobacteria bacterium]